MRILHISLNTIPIQSANPAPPYHLLHILSKSFCPYPHISPLPPPHFYRLTPNYLHSYVPHAQTTSTPQSTTPHHLSHALNPKRLYKSTLRFLSFSDTPHIQLTIIRYVLSRLCRFAFFIAQVSVLYVYTLDTSLVYLSLYAVWCILSCQDWR